jgi:multidrug efflux pump subunit AcrA (membrane-fusion protein)
VDIGAPVKAGQVLATIETPDLDQDLRQAQAQLAVARSNLALAESTAKRWQSLVAQNAVSKQEADEKQGDLHAKKSNVHGAAGQRRAPAGAATLHPPGGALRRRGHGAQYRRRRAGQRRRDGAAAANCSWSPTCAACASTCRCRSARWPQIQAGQHGAA